jgi:glycosyltransferase involved in cell wall biosynthesis
MISVITTTYNCANYIVQAIRSILNQTFQDFEYLIIDDGSTDNTEEIIEKINDIRIRYYKLEHVGRAAALNRALELAKYETIALMDADDISHPLRFEKQLKILQGADQLIFCDTAYFKNNFVRYVIKGPLNLQGLKKKLALHGHFNNSSSMFYKNHIMENGGYNENLIAYEDYDLWLRLKNKSKFIVLPELLHYFRLRNNSMTTSNPDKLKHLLYQLQKPYYEDLAKEFNIIDKNEQNILKGWREFFYGEKKLSRKYWRKINLFKREIKVNFVFILSYFPTFSLQYLKKNRFRLKFEYLIYQFKSFGLIQKEFDDVKSRLHSEG